MYFLFLLVPCLLASDPQPGKVFEGSSPAAQVGATDDVPSSAEPALSVADIGAQEDPAERERRERRERVYAAALARMRTMAVGSSKPISGPGSTPSSFTSLLHNPLAQRPSVLQYPSFGSASDFLEQSTASRGPGHRGLRNLGMTCFINSAVQVLMNAAPLRAVVRGINSTLLEERATTAVASGVWKQTEKLLLAKAFVDLTNLYWSGDNTTVVDTTPNIRSVVEALTRLDPETFVRGRMGDSHEVIKAIMDAFPSESSLPHNPIESLFQIVGEQKRKTCLTCASTEEPLDESLQDFIVKTELIGRDGGAVDLQEYVSGVLTRPINETIPAVECMACSRANGTSVRRDVRLDTATVARGDGSLLMIPLPRFQMGSILKNTVSVDIPLNLTLTEPEYQFKLTGVIYHSGSTLNFGHYTSCFVDSEDGKWYEANDGIVREVSNPVLTGETPYLLIYERTAHE